MQKTLSTIIFTFLLSLLLSACGDDTSKADNDKKAAYTTITAEKKNNTTKLYFSGNIQPLKVHSVISPVEGNIQKLFFDYGQTVKKGEKLLSISADKLKEEYYTTLTDFIKAKDTLNQSKSKYESSQYLFDKGFISSDELTTDKSSFQSDNLAEIQARLKLSSTMEQLGIKEKIDDLDELELSNIKKIANILGSDLKTLQIKSPNDGIALFPEEGSDAGDEVKQLELGSEIKAGQVLLAIGDLNGITISIEINEINMKDVKEGQKVTITGDAFSDIELQGSVVSIDEQAKIQSGGIPTFPVRIEVPTLTKAQQNSIYVGMSAKVALELVSPESISVPIAAVFREKGQSMVKIISPKNKKIKAVPVKTGQTSLSNVEILSGLKAGDEIVVPN